MNRLYRDVFQVRHHSSFHNFDLRTQVQILKREFDENQIQLFLVIRKLEHEVEQLRLRISLEGDSIRGSTSAKKRQVLTDIS